MKKLKTIDEDKRGKSKIKTPDRKWVENTYLPELDGKVLYVGVNEYTNFYHNLVKTPGAFETIDGDEGRGFHGSPTAHFHTTLQDFQPSYLYDHISLHGIHGYKGYKIDNSGIIKDIKHANSLLKPGGTLQIGPAFNQLKEYDEKYWNKVFDSLDEYEVLSKFKAYINIIWWGRKKE